MFFSKISNPKITMRLMGREIRKLNIEHILPPARLLTQMREKHNIKTACTSGLPDDEHMTFEIWK
jgi:hypothetical protein